MQNESSKSNSAFETLIKASPSDLTTSPEGYLDAIYGENRAVIMESPTSNGGLSLRRFGQGVPDTGDVLQCVSIPVDTSKLGESKLTPDTVFKHLTWSHAVALFRPGQDLSLLLQAIATGTLPVVAALSVGTTGLQLLLRINAASKGAWAAGMQQDLETIRRVKGECDAANVAIPLGASQKSRRCGAGLSKS
jgi:hypothetical protein